MSVEITRAADVSILADRFPRIGRFLSVERSGWVAARFSGWDFWTRGTLSPADRAAAYEEWAAFYLWHFERQAVELAGDEGKRRMVAEWTADMAYLCRRCAAFARGEDPGEWIPSWERRVAEIPAPDRWLVGAGAVR